MCCIPAARSTGPGWHRYFANRRGGVGVVGEVGRGVGGACIGVIQFPGSDFYFFPAPSAKVVFSGMESYVWKNAHNSNPLRVAFSIK